MLVLNVCINVVTPAPPSLFNIHARAPLPSPQVDLAWLTWVLTRVDLGRRQGLCPCPGWSSFPPPRGGRSSGIESKLWCQGRHDKDSCPSLTPCTSRILIPCSQARLVTTPARVDLFQRHNALRYRYCPRSTQHLLRLLRQAFHSNYSIEP